MTKEKSPLGFSVEGIHNENIAHLKVGSGDKSKPDGWYVGTDEVGPFESIDDVFTGSDAVAVVATRDETYLKTVIVDGKEVGTFNNCHRIPTASKKLLLQAMRLDPSEEPGRAKEHFFLLHKKGVHGPLTDLHEVEGFPCGALTAFVVGKPGTYAKKLFIDDMSHDSVYSTVVKTDRTGARYLICDDRDHKKAKTRIVTAKLLVTCDEWLMDDGVLMATNLWVRGHKETYIILGGVIVSTHVDSQVSVHPVGRRVLQCSTGKSELGKDSSMLYLDRTQISGPYDDITGLTVDENLISFTTHETDFYGKQRISVRKFLVTES